MGNAAKEKNKDFAQTMSFLMSYPLFERCRSPYLLAAAFVAVDFKAGTTIIKQGDSGNEFFVIRSGEANVIVSGAKVGTLKDGDYFGYKALLRDEPRTATITAEVPLQAFKITRDKFHELVLNKEMRDEIRIAESTGALPLIPWLHDVRSRCQNNWCGRLRALLQ